MGKAEESYREEHIRWLRSKYSFSTKAKKLPKVKAPVDNFEQQSLLFDLKKPDLVKLAEEQGFVVSGLTKAEIVELLEREEGK